VVFSEKERRFITPCGRPAYLPLIEEIASLLEMNESFRSSHNTFEQEKAFRFLNRTALICYRMGKIPQARRLCIKEVSVAADLAFVSPDNLRFCIQPWINLARLDAHEGKFEAALKRMTTLRDWERGESCLRIGRIRFPRSMLVNVEDSLSGLRAFIKSTTAIETLSYLSKAGRWKDSLVLVQTLLDEGLIIATVKEAHIISLAQVDDLAGSLSEGLRYLSNADGLSRVVIAVRVSQLLSKRGDPSAGIFLSNVICDTRNIADSKFSIEELRILIELVRLGLHMGHVDEHTTGFYKDVLERSIASGDCNLTRDARGLLDGQSTPKNGALENNPGNYTNLDSSIEHAFQTLLLASADCIRNLRGQAKTATVQAFGGSEHANRLATTLSEDSSFKNC
jgi:hypothetical protein